MCYSLFGVPKVSDLTGVIIQSIGLLGTAFAGAHWLWSFRNRELLRADLEILKLHRELFPQGSAKPIEDALAQRVRDTYGEDPRPHLARFVGLLAAGGAAVWYFGQDNGVGFTFGALLWLMAAAALRDAREASKRRRG